MPNGTYGGVRGRKTKVGRKLLRFPPTRLETLHTSTCCCTLLASKKAKELGERMIKKKSYREKKDLLKKAPESGVRIIPKQT